MASFEESQPEMAFQWTEDKGSSELQGRLSAPCLTTLCFLSVLSAGGPVLGVWEGGFQPWKNGSEYTLKVICRPIPSSPGPRQN